ncbi:MAG: excinuclease ABC subunit UvrC [bacterium]|nr:excinuclease ABC subunit UvrC [bacterium]
MSIDIKKLKKQLPLTPGVYFMKDTHGRVLYVGKAANLKRRVLSYFQRPQELRIAKMVSEVARVDVEQTDTVIEALILEARLIKKYQPQYNVLEKDDRSFLYVVITREVFPRVLLLREREALSHDRPLGRFGPFTSAASLREALHILRRIFPWSSHEINKGTPSTSSGNKIKKLVPEFIEGQPKLKPCFNYQIGLCPGTCAGVITSRDYKKIIRQLIAFFEGKKQKILRDLTREMRVLSRELKFEEAVVIRRRIAALQHIHDIAVLGDKATRENDFHRVEGYDISHVSGTSAVGSMVVFTDGAPDKNEYRKFRIKTIIGSNDVGMLAEVLRRRFTHDEWPMPDLLLIDGGLPQVNAARAVIAELKLPVPVVGIAKGPERKRNDFFYPHELHTAVARNRDMLIRVRDEAHRFAVKYHRELRSRLRKY